MRRLLMWPSSEGYVAEDRYVEILQMFMNQYTDVG